MADSTLSSLTAASALDAADLFYVVQGGADRKATGTQVIALAGGAVFASKIAGNWYHPMPGLTSANGATLVQDVIRFHPVYIDQQVTISDLAAYMSTAASGQNVQFAIYARSASTGKPTGAALAATGNVACTTTGPISGALTSNVQLSAGTYFFAINSSSGTPIFNVVGTADTTFGAVLGSATLANLLQGSNTSLFVYTLLSQTFGTWPTVTGASFNEVNTTDRWALIRYKVTSVP